MSGVWQNMERRVGGPVNVCDFFFSFDVSKQSIKWLWGRQATLDVRACRDQVTVHPGHHCIFTVLIIVLIFDYTGILVKVIGIQLYVILDKTTT